MKENKHKQTSRIFLLLLLMLACCSFQCKPKENKPQTAEDHIVSLCKKLSIDVKAKRKENHLGVCLNTYNLFNDKKRNLKINRIIHCANDTIAEYKSEIDFFHILIRDETSGVENRYIWTSDDIQKSKINIISPKEFRSRALMDAGNNLYLLGHKRIGHFFELLPSHTLKDILQVNPRITLKIFSKSFFHHLLETSMKENVEYDILSVSTKAVSNDKMLFYYRVRHLFSPKSSFQKSSFKYPSGSIMNFVFGIENMSYLDARISEIYSFAINENYDSTDISSEIKSFEHPQNWLEKDFHIENIDKAGFVARLIAQKIRLQLNYKDKTLDKQPNIKNINGTCEKSNGNQILQIIFQADQTDQDIPFEEITTICKDVSIEVCEIYNFKDFESIKLFFPEKGIIKTINRDQIGL